MDSPKSSVAVEKSSSGLSKFLTKLYEIVHDPAYNEYVTWTQEGKAVMIKDVDKFEQDILPICYKHRSFSSFIRQLNMYDFKKEKNEDGKGCVFIHPFFQKDQRKLAERIRRKKPKYISKRIIEKEIAKRSEPLSPHKKEQEFEEVKSLLSEVRKSINFLEKKVDELRNSNQCLVTQVQQLETTLMLHSAQRPRNFSETAYQQIYPSNVAKGLMFNQGIQTINLLPRHYI